MLTHKHQIFYHTFFWVLYLLGQCFSIKGSLETTLSHISYIDKQQNQIQKIKYQHLYHTFLESYSIQEQAVLCIAEGQVSTVLLHSF